MRNFYGVALVGLSVLCFANTYSYADMRWKRCIRMSFPSNGRGTMTNLCGKNLYAVWYDDNGEHTTAIGANYSLGVGTIHGRFQIHDAYLQSGDEKEAKDHAKFVNPNRQTSNAKKQECEERKEHNYRSANMIEGSDPGLANSLRSSADTAYSSCLRGGDFSSAYHAALNGRGSVTHSRVSRTNSKTIICPAGDKFCIRDCIPADDICPSQY